MLNTALQTRPGTCAELLTQAAAHERDGRHEQAVELLRRNAHPSLTAWARSVVDEGCRWLVSPSSRDYDHNRFDDAPSLLGIGRRLYLWVEADDHPSPLHHDLDKAFTTFTCALSEMCHQDAEVLRLASHKRLPDGITPELLMEAWPETARPAPVNTRATAAHNSTQALNQASREFSTIKTEMDQQVRFLQQRILDCELRTKQARDRLAKAQGGLFEQGALR